MFIPDIHIDYWKMLAGVSAFIYAMLLIEDSVRTLSSRTFKKFLQEQTKVKFRALLSGALTTAFLQSSSIVILMTLSFVGAGVIPLRNALAVALGSNLGTTFNSWLIAYVGFRVELTTWIYPMMAICLVGFLLFRENKTISNFTKIVFGVSLLFIALQWIKESAPELSNTAHLQQFTGYSSFWFLIIGFVITVLLQSSSITFGLSLTAIQSGILSLPTAAFMIIGAELGTTIKIGINAIRGSTDQKRLATANILFNLTTVLFVALFLVQPLLQLIESGFQISDRYITLATFQSLFNLSTILFFYPWLGTFCNWIEKAIPEKNNRSELHFLRMKSKILDSDLWSDTEKEMMHLMSHCMEYFQLTIIGEERANPKQKSAASWFKRIFSPTSHTEVYNRLKVLQSEILDYLVSTSKETLSNKEELRCNKLITASRYFLVSAKYLKDIQHNLDELSASANDELYNSFQSIQNEEKQFLEKFKVLFLQNTNSAETRWLEGLLTENKLRQKLANEQTLHMLAGNKITQLNASTLLNIHRAIYTSHRSFLNAIFELNDKEDASA
ncbi:MAG: Na/Pi cotransporter family protein [Bacteroidetes bacterium]|nr:Na/Pi cotransporter family protein [Bacteroidota bacterium]